MNRGRASELMQRHGLEATIVTSPQNVRYVTQYEPIEAALRPIAAVIPAAPSAPPVAALPADEIARILDAGLDQQIGVVLYGPSPEPTTVNGNWGARYGELAASTRENALDAVLSALDTLDISGGIAVEDGQYLDSAALVEANERDYRPHGGDILFLVRMVKTDGEVDSIRRAAAVNEAGIQAAVAIAADASLYEIGEIHRSTVAEAGGSVSHFCMNDVGAWRHWGGGSLRRYAGIPGLAANPIAPGTRLAWDAGITVEGYFSDLGGTLVVGRTPSADEDATYAALSCGVEEALRVAAPGVTAGELYDCVVAAIRDAGIKDYTPNSIGHLTGTAHQEGKLAKGAPTASPFLPDPLEITLEPGTVFNIEVQQTPAGVGAFQYELTCATTDTGVRLLSRRRTLQAV